MGYKNKYIKYTALSVFVFILSVLIAGFINGDLDILGWTKFVRFLIISGVAVIVGLNMAATNSNE